MFLDNPAELFHIGGPLSSSEADGVAWRTSPARETGEERKRSAAMQYSTMVRTREMIGRGVPRALKTRVGEHRRTRSRAGSVRAPGATRDAWVQANAGARSQSDFWLKLLVVRNMGRPPL